MVKAKTREEFIKCWTSEFDVMAMLAQSLPTKDGVALEYLTRLFKLRPYIETAATDTYGPGTHERTFYHCLFCGWELETAARRIRCGKCGSLNLERRLPDGRLIKADADEKAPGNARLIHACGLGGD